MKSHRLQYSYRESASRLHKKVGELLRNSPVLSNYRIYQEYPVNKINPSFKSGREKFDWVILDLKIVIECHGEQHYKPVTFGGISEEEALSRYQDQIFRDNRKRDAAEEAGFSYIEIPYSIPSSELDDGGKIHGFIFNAVERQHFEGSYSSEGSSESSVSWKDRYRRKKEWEEESGFAETRRKRQREWRRKQYRRAKQLKKERDVQD